MDKIDRYNVKINRFKLAWRVLFNARYRDMLCDVIVYAMNNHEDKRGQGASDVLFYKMEYSDDIFKEAK